MQHLSLVSFTTSLSLINDMYPNFSCHQCLITPSIPSPSPSSKDPFLHHKPKLPPFSGHHLSTFFFMHLHSLSSHSHRSWLFHWNPPSQKLSATKAPPRSNCAPPVPMRFNRSYKPRSEPQRSTKQFMFQTVWSSSSSRSLSTRS